ncbi:MAG TPA: HAD hydrolase family protein [Desulfobacteraceae bacterium]|nr:HAD hydrolase family protein [Desulfobacteraceae bacterium]
MTPQLETIKLLLLDVDGVLTRGQVIYSDSGEQIKSFHARDGLGLRLLMDSGIQAGIITGRTSRALFHRCDNLGIDLVLDNIKEKGKGLKTMSDRTGIPFDQIAFVGDDLIDLSAMNLAGLAITVPDAPREVKERAAIVTTARGGEGAVREVCEEILKAQGMWQKAIQHFLQ